MTCANCRVTLRDPNRDMTDPSRPVTEPLNHASRTPSRTLTDEGVTLPLKEKGSRDRDRAPGGTHAARKNGPITPRPILEIPPRYRGRS